MQGREARYLAVFCSFFDLKAKIRFLGKVKIEVHAVYNLYYYFGIIVVVHEFGHFYFAKKSGILVREFAIGMGPKIFSHIGKDGTAYTIRILPLGGYVRMAGWGGRLH